MNIYLVRHAQSESNADLSILHTRSNVGVKLTELGLIQAKETADYMSKYIKQDNQSCVVWNSPYERTRLTASIIKERLSIDGINITPIESIYLSERQFGILDDAQDYQNSHPNEFNHYKIHTEENKQFFVRPPLGESAFDMCMRLDFFIKSILNQRTEENHIIVSHGAAIRGFIMMYCNNSYEEYSNMENPGNASVSFIGNEQYEGIVFQPKQVL